MERVPGLGNRRRPECPGLPPDGCRHGCRGRGIPRGGCHGLRPWRKREIHPCQYGGKCAGGIRGEHRHQNFNHRTAEQRPGPGHHAGQASGSGWRAGGKPAAFCLDPEAAGQYGQVGDRGKISRAGGGEAKPHPGSVHQSSAPRWVNRRRHMAAADGSPLSLQGAAG